MKSSIIATAALVAAAAADSVGSAVVINKCKYDVYLSAVPSSGGGYSETDKTLSENGTWTQTYTQLSNGNGWSIKLANATSTTDILQYEYTFQNDGTIWYDLSEVNGNPWDGDWEITADDSSCTPKQSAYRYATDDAYGMQACPQDSTITVTLCSGESQDDTAASSVSSSVAAQSTTSSFSTTVSAPASVSNSVSSAPASSSESLSTTLSTSVLTTSSAEYGNNVVVTLTEVATATATATATAWTHSWGNGKREAHRHHARHPHAHRN